MHRVGQKKKKLEYKTLISFLRTVKPIFEYACDVLILESDILTMQPKLCSLTKKHLMFLLSARFKFFFFKYSIFPFFFF